MKSLGILAARAACLVALAASAMPGRAATEHEQEVGAQVEQLCDTRALAAVGRHVNVANFKEPALGHDADAGAMVAAAACRAVPALHGRLVAAAYRSGHQDDLLLVIALLDASGNVTSSFKGAMDADPALKIVSGSLWLDTAAYDVAPGLRAFGLDVTSGAPRGCAGVGSGARRSLFVSQGRFIRSVLQDLPMSEWALIQRGKSACTDSSAPELTITENFAAKLALAPTSTRGYRDLVVTGAASRDDGHLDERPPFSAVLKWDGRMYAIDAQQQAWAAWRQ
ncbi:MAG: hypothetical protein JF586_00600 [Burkholderiales bacterium]|nr:hypothetical protein [Burkholderiales bacterium]